MSMDRRVLIFGLLFTPFLAFAGIDTFVASISEHIINPIIYFAFVLAVVYFIYGIFEFIKDADSGEAREKGRKHILFGLIGITIMVMVFFIMRVILKTLKVPESEINIQNNGEVNVNLDQ